MNLKFTTVNRFVKCLCLAALVGGTMASCSSSTDEMDEVMDGTAAGETPIALFSNVLGMTRSELEGSNEEQESTSQGTTLVDTGIQNEAFVTGETLYAWIDDSSNNALYKAKKLTVGSNNALTDSNSALYYPVSGSTVNVTAIHGTVSGITENTTAKPSAYNFTVNTSQTTNANYLASDLVYGYGSALKRQSSAHQITFYHMLSKVIFKVTLGTGFDSNVSVSSIKIGSVVTAGTFTPDNSKLSTLSDRNGMISAGSTTGDVTVRSATESTYDWDAILVPQDVAGKVITFTLSNNQTMTYTFPAATSETLVTSLVSGKAYTYTATLKPTGITLTSKITGWVGTTGGSFDAGMADAK
jgi:hypothetical protein